MNGIEKAQLQEFAGVREIVSDLDAIRFKFGMGSVKVLTPKAEVAIRSGRRAQIPFKIEVISDIISHKVVMEFPMNYPTGPMKVEVEDIGAGSGDNEANLRTIQQYLDDFCNSHAGRNGYAIVLLDIVRRYGMGESIDQLRAAAVDLNEVEVETHNPPDAQDTDGRTALPYKCRKCRYPLFHSENIECHDAPSKSSPACSSFFLSEATGWLQSNVVDVSGKIHCPSCDSKVGAYNWSGSKCSCGAWVVPSIQFSRGKIDQPPACEQHSDVISAAVSSAMKEASTCSVEPSESVIPQKIAYGSTSSQFFELYTPTDTTLGSVPVAVIIHGGFWKEKYRIDNSAIDSLTPFLLSSGMAVCLVEYRRIGAEDVENEGGWPETNEDILQALRKLHQIATEQDQLIASSVFINMDRVALIGHSAGGYLALWTCCHLAERSLPFKPALCVAIAPVCDLAEACRRRLSDEGDAVEKFMKTPFDDSTASCLQMYNEACPSKLLPLEVPSVIAIGTADTDIPADMVEGFCAFVSQHGDSAPITLLALESADHYDVVNAASPAWGAIFSEIRSI